MTKPGFICIFLSLLLIRPAYGSEAPSNLIFLSEHLPPYQIGDSDRLIGGTIGLKVKAVVEKHYPGAVINVMPWARAYKMALVRPNTVIFSIVRTPEREKLFHWISKVESVQTKLITKKSSPIAPISRLSELRGYQVGVKRDDAVSYVFLKYGFQYGEDLIEIVNTMSTMRMLQRGRIDVIPSNDHIINFFCQTNGCTKDDFNVIYTFNELSEDFYIAASLGTDPQLVNELRLYFQAI